MNMRNLVAPVVGIVGGLILGSLLVWLAMNKPIVLIILLLGIVALALLRRRDGW